MNEVSPIVNVVVIGESGVGKSSLVNRFAVDGSFKTKPTMGVDYFRREIAIEGRPVEVRFWDTAGTERFRSICEGYYKIASGVMLVFDVTVRESFERLDDWLTRVKEKCRNQVKVVLVGNKLDLVDRRKVGKEEALAFAQKHEMFYFEVSAISEDRTEVNKAFMELLNEAYQVLKNENDRRSTLRGNFIKQEIFADPPEKKKCC